jgi:hypothetical protein
MTVVETYEPIGILKPVTDGVWIVDGPVIGFGYLGMKFSFPTRMTIVQLADGGLWVHSPTNLPPSLKGEVDALGRVRYLIAPNRIHYWWVEEWVAAYPNAMTYAAPGVQDQARSNGRFSDYNVDLVEDGEYPWSGEIRMLLVPGRYLSEAVFFHDVTRTLVITDLIQNYEREKIASPFFRFMSRFSGAVNPDGKMPIDLRATFFMHRKKMAEAVRTMIFWQPKRIIIAHGRWYRGNAVAELKRAFRWLPCN